MRLRFLSIISFVVIAAAASSVLSAETPGRAAIPRNAAPGIAYLGSAACAGCHASLYESYRQTGMGRSMSLASDAAPRSSPTEPVTVFQENTKRHFTLFRQGADLYQSQYELDGSGKEVFRDVHKLEYAIGSGANGQSFVIRRSDFLFQAPLSYYSKPGKWDLSPGFELQDAAFNRPIHTACVACHSGRANPVKQRPAAYGEPAFYELAIGCENCHGPGQLHVAERSQGLAVPNAGDSGIVNPARLPMWLGDNICMNCHQAGGTRVLKPGKDHLDFRPGTPLNDTVGIFRARDEKGSGDLLEHYSAMRLSRCYRESKSQLSCIGCHSPHSEPSVAEAPAYYRNKCLRCHSNASCSVSLSRRLKESPPNDCAGCHMPKREIGTIAHSALTNHRIPARMDQADPEPAFPVSSAIPDVIHLNAPLGRENAPVPLLTQLQVYGELLPQFPSYRDRYLATLDQLAHTQPQHPLVLSALARREKLKATAEGNDRALQYLSQALAAGSTSVLDYQDFADLLARAGRSAEAIGVLEKALALFPLTPVLYKALSLQFIQQKRYADALRTMRRHLELFPEDAFMRNLLKQAEAAPIPR